MIYLERTGWKVNARPDIYNNSHEIVISLTGLDGKEKIYTPQFVAEHSSMSLLPDEGIINVGKEFLQAFLDCAWEMGLRPQGFSNVQETLKAKQEHIDDLRNVTTSLLSIAKEQS